MRTVLFLALWIACCIPNTGHAQVKNQQNNSQLPVYQQFPTLPPFQLYLEDGSVYNKQLLHNNKPTVLIIFSVECDHCKILTEDITKKIEKFKNVNILMITPFRVDRMKEYYNEYKIGSYPNITMVSEPTRQIMYFYGLREFPGVYIYDKKRQLKHEVTAALNVENILSSL